MLPEIIHYCWFGGKEMPDQYKKIVETWTEMHPTWTIKRWDESNAPMQLPYIKKAVENNHWANVSNYVRFYALLHEGGIYMDTDMKVLQPLNKLLSYDCFLGFESGEDGSGDFWVNNAILGAVPHHPFIVECEKYLLQEFDGTEQANLSSPQLVTKVLKDKYNLKQYGRQLLGDIMLFEKEVFYPIAVDKAYMLKEDLTYPDQTIAVHLWGRTWFTNEMLIDEMDNLRRYTHELRTFNEQTTSQLQQSIQALEVARAEIQTIEIEKSELKTNIFDTLKEIERKQHSLEQVTIEIGKKQSTLEQFSITLEKNQTTLEQFSIETDRKVNELITYLKIMQKQQEELITSFKNKYEQGSLWSIAKRKLLKFKNNT